MRPEHFAPWVQAWAHHFANLPGGWNTGHWLSTDFRPYSREGSPQEQGRLTLMASRPWGRFRREVDVVISFDLRTGEVSEVHGAFAGWAVKVEREAWETVCQAVKGGKEHGVPYPNQWYDKRYNLTRQWK